MVKILSKIFSALFLVAIILIPSLAVAQTSGRAIVAEQGGIRGWICPAPDARWDETAGATSPLVDCVPRLYDFALGVTGLLAVAIMVAAGYLYMTSGGDGQQLTKAKEMGGAVAAGLLLLLTAYLLLNFLNPRLLELRGFERIGITFNERAKVTLEIPRPSGSIPCGPATIRAVVEGSLLDGGTEIARIDSATLYVDGDNVARMSPIRVDTAFSFVMTQGFAVGSHFLEVKAQVIGSDGKSTELTSGRVNFSVTSSCLQGTTAFRITSPVQDATEWTTDRGIPITFSAAIQPGVLAQNIREVRMTTVPPTPGNESAVVTRNSSGVYSRVISTAEAPSVMTLQIEGYNAEGRLIGYATLKVNVRGDTPAAPRPVVITAPTNGTVITGTSAQITTNIPANADGVESVQLKIERITSFGATELQSVTLESPYSYHWNLVSPQAVNGDYRITVTLNYTTLTPTSASVNVKVDR